MTAVSTGFSSFSWDQQSNLGMSFSCQWQKCKKESRNTQGPLRLGLQLSHCYFWGILLDKASHIRWSVYLTLVGRTRKFAWQREWIQRGWIVGPINAIHVSHHFALDPTNSDELRKVRNIVLFRQLLSSWFLRQVLVFPSNLVHSEAFWWCLNVCTYILVSTCSKNKGK